MICNKCNQRLPDDSEFCQYCGNKIQNQDANDIEIKKDTEFIETSVIEVEKKTQQNIDEAKEKFAKNRFCKVCGSIIDMRTKKCSGCGKQYFRGIKFNKFLTTTLILSLVIITSVWLNIVQIVKVNELNSDNEYYIKQIDEQQKEIEKIGKSLNFYEKNAAVVPDDGSKKYHIYGCDDLDLSNSGWLYSYRQAERQGYYACPKCH